MDVFLTEEARKQYKKLSKAEKDKVDKKIILLFKEPFIGKKLTGEYKNFKSLKAWPYRIIYWIDEPKKIIWVISILHRQGAYK